MAFSGSIPRAFIQEVLARTDLVSLIQRRVKLKKKGTEFSACCPFHQEKTASFYVSPRKQFYYCFGCGAHGNALSFVMDYDRLPFVEAVEALAQLLGLNVPLPHERFGQHVSHQQVDFKPLYAVMENAAAHYQTLLSQSEPAKTYLSLRKLSPEILTTFKIGYAASAWDDLIRHFPGSDQQTLLERAGLVIAKEQKRYDRFRHRVMFPIRNYRGEMIGFGGRVIDANDTPKYLNSPETAVFHKGKSLYGLYETLQANRHVDRFIIVEGYMDVVSLFQHGITNAVATLGTATTADHIQLMQRFSKEMVFCFDGDNAGRKAAWRAVETILPALTDGLQIRFMFLPEGEDPDSCVQSMGSQGFNRYVDSAISLPEYFFQHFSEQTDTSKLDGRVQFTQLALPHIQKVPGKIYRELLRNQLAQMMQLSHAQIDSLAAATETRTSAYLPARSTPVVPKVRTAVERALALLLQLPQLVANIPENFWQKIADTEEIQLFRRISEELSATPDITTGVFLECFREDPIYPKLAKLSAWEAPFPLSGMVAEFDLCLQRLQAISRDDTLAKLIQQSRIRALSPEESERMLALLKAKHAAKTTS